MPKPAKPYVDDAEYLEAELAWIDARCRHIHAKREASNTVAQFPVSRHESKDANRLLLFAWQSRKTKARNEEIHHRTELDRRLAVMRRNGGGPALDRLCGSHELGECERTLLLLAAASTITRAFEPLFADLSDFVSEGVLCPGVLFDFLGRSTADRVRAREIFLPDRPLCREGLIDIQPMDVLADPTFVETPIRIRARALGAMLGRTPISNH